MAAGNRKKHLEFTFARKELVQFIKENGLGDSVMQRFILEKIDKSAVLLMSDNQLEEIGITTMGDRLRIRAFCQRKANKAGEQKKRQEVIEKMTALLDHQKPKKRSRGRDTLGQKEKHTKMVLKFEFGWKHWCSLAGIFKQKKKNSGGGTRVLDVPKQALASECLDMAKELFFPNGISSEGLLDEMNLTLGDFNGGSVIEVNVDGEFLPFTAERYKMATGFTKPRLYLLSKEKVAYDSGDEKELLHPVLPPPDAQSYNRQSQLIGTSKEREEFCDQLKRDLAASLLQDRGKDEEKRKKEERRLSAINREITRVEQERAELERLRLYRLERLLPEAKEDESYVLVKVRLTSLGIVTRRFMIDAAMWNVYDWVGSLSCTPRYFSLSKDPKEIISPAEGVQIANSHLLVMVEEDDPLPLMEDDKEVTFYSDQLTGETLDDTLLDRVDKGNESCKVNEDSSADMSGQFYQVASVSSELPHVIMEEDESLESKANYCTLQPQRREEEEKLKCEICFLEIKGNDASAHPIGCYCYFHAGCLRELLKTAGDDYTIKCPVCQITIPGMVEEACQHGTQKKPKRDKVNNRRGQRVSPADKGFFFRQHYLADVLKGEQEEETMDEKESMRSSPSLSPFEEGICNTVISTQNPPLPCVDSGPVNDSAHTAHMIPSSDITVQDPGGQECKERTLRIRRQLVLQDLIQAFSNEEILTCDIKVVMVDSRGNDEMGEDVKGIYRDVLACFWQEFYISCTLGERERVPSLRHDFQCNEWTAVGRIIAKGYADLGYLPTMLSPAFITSVLFGEKEVCEETLLDSFYRYLAQDDEDVVREALKGREGEGSAEYEELLDLLDRYGCRKLPTPQNVKELILELAHKELIQRPQYVADCWSVLLLKYLKGSDLSTAKKLQERYIALQPTTRKVIGMIQAKPCNNSERSALDHLKRFIRGMDLTQLKSFLMFVTGADVLCVDTIDVEFTQLDGLQRRPIAHTCGCVLELPSTYDSYMELRAEFSNVLAKGKWQNDIC